MCACVAVGCIAEVLAGEDADGDGKVSCGERIDYAWNALLGPAPAHVRSEAT